MDLEGRVGPQPAADGAAQKVRLGRTGCVSVGSAHGDYYEASSRGNVFSGNTAAAGVAPGTAFSTTPPWALWNPTSSGKTLNLLLVSLGYVSGTLGAGTISFGLVAGQALAPTGGTELVPQCNLLNNSRGSGRVFQGSTLAATPTLLRPFCSMGPALATTAAFPFMVKDLLDGEFSVPPGSVFVVQGSALGAGTSPLVLFGGTWEEVILTGT
jgi:hypothetical protein